MTTLSNNLRDSFLPKNCHFSRRWPSLNVGIVMAILTPKRTSTQLTKHKNNRTNVQSLVGTGILDKVCDQILTPLNIVRKSQNSQNSQKISQLRLTPKISQLNQSQNTTQKVLKTTKNTEKSASLILGLITFRREKAII